MTRILTTIHLSDIQKEVLTKVAASPTPQVAWEAISQAAEEVDSNMASARDTLGNLGLLYVGDGQLDITEQGEKVMADENLMDEMGELTDEGRQIADIRRRPPGPEEQPEPPMPNGEQEGSDMDQMGGGLPMESFGLVKTINERAEVQERIKRLNS